MGAWRAVPAALLAGASGLGTQVVLLGAAGLALGQGRGEALALALSVAGWGLGAQLAGRSALTRRAAPALGLAAALAAALGPRLVLALAERAPAGAAAYAGTLAVVLAAAVGAGALLALVVRVALAGGADAAAESDAAERARAFALVWSADLAGAVLGAFLAFHAQAALGLGGASAVLGALALLAGVATLAAAPSRGSRARVGGPADAGAARAPHERERRDGLSWAQAGLVVGLASGALVVVEWIGLRLCVLWVGGMQAALSLSLAASLLALAVGAALAAALARARASPAARARTLALVLALAGLGLLHLALLGLSADPSTSFGAWLAGPDAGARLAGDASLAGFLRASALVAPALVPFGALVPLVWRAAPAAQGGEGARRLGRLCVHEAWGALLLLPLAHELLVPRLGLAGGLLAACGALVLAASALAPRARLASALALGCCLAAGLGAWRAPAAALASPPLASPELSVRAFAEDEHFAVAVLDDGASGERTLSTDGFRAAGTGRQYRYMRALGALPVLLHPAPERACVLAFGTGTSAGALARQPRVGALEVLEISRAVAGFASWFEEVNGGVLAGLARDGARSADGRVSLVLDDGRHALALRPRRYDLLTLEPLLPDSPFAVHLYTPGFYALARGALRGPDALVCQWVPPHALEPATFEAVLDAFARSFAWSGAFLFGTQLVLVGADAPPALDAARFEVPDDTPGGEELALLGLAEPAGLLARWVGELCGRTRAARALEDADPWIVFRPRRRGAVLLGDLPANLARLAQLEGPPPPGWLAVAGERALDALESGRAVRAARRAFALEEARARGLALEGLEPAPGAEEARFEDALARARASLPHDPEARELARERAFLAHLRRGVALLGASTARESAAAALEDLVAAVELAPERADVHLYLGTALARLGAPAARQALASALQRCPRLERTREGRRALEQLGLPLAALASARASLQEDPPTRAAPSAAAPERALR